MVVCAHYSAFCSKSEVDTVQIDLDFDCLLLPTEKIITVGWMTSSDPETDPNGIRIVQQFLPVTGSTVSALIAGGESGKTYTVCAYVETSTGKADRACAYISIYPCGDALTGDSP